MLKEIEKKYIDLTKELIGEYKKKGFNLSFIKVEVNGNESRNDYTVKVLHNL
jgi:hypothetical protein